MPPKGVSTVRQVTGQPQSAAYVPPQRQPCFSHAFNVLQAVGEESAPFVFTLAGHIVRVVAAVRRVGSDNIVISLRKNFVEFAQVIITAGAHLGQVFVDEPFTETDLFTVSIVSGGTDAEDLTVLADPR